MRQRREARARASYKVFFGTKRATDFGITRNLSFNGLSVIALPVHPLNTTLKLELRVGEETLRLRGYVRWIKRVQGEERPDLLDEMGVQLISDSDEYRALVRRLLARHERRRDPRHSERLRAVMLQPRLRVSIQTGDLSRSGVFLITGQRHALGETLRFKLLLPPDDAPLSLEGRVVHVVDADTAASSASEAGVGVELQDLLPDDEVRLRRHVHRLEPVED
jgi:Tfp pilus assembly protein PilZ